MYHFLSKLLKVYLLEIYLEFAHLHLGKIKSIVDHLQQKAARGLADFVVLLHTHGNAGLKQVETILNRVDWCPQLVRNLP